MALVPLAIDSGSSDEDTHEARRPCREEFGPLEPHERSGEHFRSLDPNIRSSEDVGPLVPHRPVPRTVGKVIVNGSHNHLHIGTNINVNLPVISVHDGRNLEDFSDRIQYRLEDVLHQPSLLHHTNNRAQDNTKITILQEDEAVYSYKWYWVVAALVATTCILCIVSSSVFSLNSLQLWTEEVESQDLDLAVVSSNHDEYIQNAWLVVALGALACMNLVTMVLFSVTRLRHNTRAPQMSTRQQELVLEEITPDTPGMKRRHFWNPLPRWKALNTNILPVRQVVICHTETPSPEKQPDICARIRQMQRYQMETLAFDDIGYNFMIGADSIVYEGRGWDFVPAHTRDHNLCTLAIAFIGNFTHQEPKDSQFDALRNLIQMGLQLKKISQDYSLVAACQLQKTDSPGLTVVKKISCWSHFDHNLPLRIDQPPTNLDSEDRHPGKSKRDLRQRKSTKKKLSRPKLIKKRL